MIENRAFLADDIFRGAKFKHGLGQIAVLVNRFHDDITKRVLFIRETHQL